MSLCNNNHFQIKKNTNFSLFKREKKRVFGIYKDLRYSKFINPVRNFNSNTCTNLNNFIFSKEINLKFLSTLEKENISNQEKRKSVFGRKNEINLQKDKRSSTFIKKNVLIKPIMIEDVIYDNNVDNQKKPEFSFKSIYDNNSINSYKYYNCNDWFNNYNYNINKIIYSPFLNNKSFINIDKSFKNYFQNEFGNNYKIKNITDKNHSITNLQNSLKNSAFIPDKNIINNLIIQNNKNNSNYNSYHENSNYKLNQTHLIEPKNNNNSIISNNSKLHFNIEKSNNLLTEEKVNSSIASSTALDTVINNNEENLNRVKKHLNKGRKIKNSNLESKHTKYSTDNMMRKIKNKVIESSRILINKILKEEFSLAKDYTFPYREFKKIQGAFSQELNIKYNFWFYQIKIKDIFCLEMSNKYTTIQKSSNKELVDYLYSDINKNNFIKTKKLLDAPFHQFYHDIFLGENQEWTKFYGINDKDNKFEINYLLKTLEEEEEKNGETKIEEAKYINDIHILAHNYENFFLEKKPRKLDHNNKKNEFIKTFIINVPNEKYLKLAEETKKFREFYEKRNLLKINNNKNIGEINGKSVLNINNIKSNEIENNITNNYNETKENIKERIIDNKENNDNILFMNKDEKELNNLKNLQKGIEENKYQNSFCNRKRGREKIRYFISCKKAKQIDDSNKIFLIKKLNN